MADIKVRRKDVVDFMYDSNECFGWCDWCSHYQHLDVCSYCYNNSRYSLDWRLFYEEHKEEIDEYVRKEREKL